jgi:hypothetical protein
VVGAKGFEPSTSWSRTRRASQAALRPDMSAPPYLGQEHSPTAYHSPASHPHLQNYIFLRDRLDRRELSGPISSPHEHTFDSIYQLEFVDSICRSSSQSPKQNRRETRVSRRPIVLLACLSAKTHTAMRTASRAGSSAAQCSCRSCWRSSATGSSSAHQTASSSTR